MADDAIEQRTERKAPWTKIFTAFKVALDVKKLLLAAAGILAMAAGWWLLSVIFYNTRSVPQPVDYVAGATTEAEKEESWKAFRQARERWNLLYELAGPVTVSPDQARENAGDVALSYEDFQEIRRIEGLTQSTDKQKEPLSLEAIRAEIMAGDAAKRDAGLAALARYRLMLDRAVAKPHGRLRTWPWFEDRGPNPYLLVSEKIKEVHSGERSEYWPRGSFLGWFVSNQLKVLLEPLVKLLSPIAYFFDARAGAGTAFTFCASSCGRSSSGAFSAGPSRAWPSSKSPATRKSACARPCSLPASAASRLFPRRSSRLSFWAC